MLDDLTLAKSEIVANSSMNRERGLAGPNSYSRDLQFDVLGFLQGRLRERGNVTWLDLCCGSGRALIEAGQALPDGRAEFVGVDLVSAFAPLPPELDRVRFIAAPLSSWTAEHSYDLITCVHGLHYVGDKVGLIARAVSWLSEEGRFFAHLDPSNMRFEVEDVPVGRPAGPAILKHLRRHGLQYDPRKRLLVCTGPKQVALIFDYLGADDGPGPNYTGQPAVNSYYR